MNIFEQNPIEIEAKENTSPSIEIKLNTPTITTSCGCTDVEQLTEPQVFKINISKLTAVKYMVSDINKIDHYIKQVSVNIYGQSLKIKIKVTT